MIVLVRFLPIARLARPARGLRGALVGLGLCLGLGLLGGGCGDPAAPDGAPRPVGGPLEGPLACEAPRLDFGRVLEGQVLSARFDLEVRGPDPIAIESVRADCGCTTSDLLVASAEAPATFGPYAPGTPLGVGARLRLEVAYDSSGKRGREERDVTLYANVPGGRVALGLVAEVEPWLLAEPDLLELGRLGTDAGGQAELTVHSVGGQPFALTHDASRGLPAGIVADLTPIDAGDDGRAARWRVRVELAPGLREGAHQYPLYLTSDHALPASAPDAAPRKASVTPQLQFEVVGRFRVEPASLVFQGVTPETTVARTVRVQSFDDSVALSAPTARLEALPVEEGGSADAILETARADVRPAADGTPAAWDVQVLVEGLAPEVGNRFLATVVLETGHPDQPRLEIPVLGFRAAGR